jgi:hypothetical protein
MDTNSVGLIAEAEIEAFDQDQEQNEFTLFDCFTLHAAGIDPYAIDTREEK